MNIILLILLLFSLNIDALFFGINFGLRKIKIIYKSKIIIFLVSFILSLSSYLFGNILSKIFSITLSNIIGSILLVFLGSFIILKTLIDNKNNKTVLNITIKYIEITIKIIKEPSTSDINNSGIIEPFEALLMSIALSLDALSVSFSLSLSKKISIIIPILIPVFQYAFITIGNKIGSKIKIKNKNRVLSIIPGLIIILLGLLKL
ncbi:manganese efflux pump [Caldicellulosiruptoraceae bacterium PP1]